MSTPADIVPDPAEFRIDALRNEIHVFPVWLEDTPAAQDFSSPSPPPRSAWGLLSPEEAARAHAYIALRAQAAFVHCRALLRRMLGAYLRRPPSSLVFSYGEFGKPSLVTYPELCFNISHSGSVALLAFTLGAPLGVDIERMRSMPNALALADRFFAPRESAFMRALPACQLDQAFLTCWTRKEAAVKALGVSLDGQLASFTVPLEPMPAPRTIAISATPLLLHSLTLAPQAVGALAQSGAPRPLRIEPFRHAALVSP